MKKFFLSVRNFFKPEINEEELINYIAEKSSIPREDVTIILDLEIEFLKEKNIVR